jgi:hypothetical protein
LGFYKNKTYLAAGNGVFLLKTAFADGACNTPPQE